MIVILTVCSLFIGCSTNMHYKNLNSSNPKSDSERLKYTFLFEKAFYDKGCLAAFHKEGLLYLITKESSSFSVSVYNPKINIFATAAIRTSGYVTCKTVDFVNNRLLYVARLHFFVSPEYRQLFDNYKDHPEALKNAITSGPSYFGLGGQYNGQKSTLNLPNNNFKDIYSLFDLESQLRDFNKHKAKQLISARQSEVERITSKYKAIQEASQEKQRRAKEQWTNRMSQKLKVGDKVCSYTNLFGYLEKMSGHKIKVHVVGDASQYKGDEGYFFQGASGEFQYTKIEAIRWFKRSEVSHCHFN